MNGKGEARGNTLLWIIAAVAVVLLVKPDLLSGLTGGAAPSVSTPTTVTSTGVVQTSVADVTVTVNTWDKFAKNTEIGNGSHRVFLNGVDKGWFVDGGSFKASPGDKLVVYFGLNSTSNYPVKKEYSVANTKGTLEAAAGLLKVDHALTLTAFDEFGTKVSATNTQALTNNDIKSLEVRGTADSKTGFGDVDHPGQGNIICAVGNQTSYDSLKIQGSAKAFQPQAQTSSTGNSVWCYYRPAFESNPDVAGTGDDKWQLEVDVKDVDPTGANSNITINYYDTGYDLDANTLAEILSVEDESGNDLGTVSSNQVIIGVA